jgi:hypothetical protein
MSLTIEMQDERLDSFILVFKDSSALDAWKSQMQGLVTSYQNQPSSPQPPVDRGLDMDEFGGSAKAARMLSRSTDSTTPSTVDESIAGLRALYDVLLHLASLRPSSETNACETTSTAW